MKKNSAYNFNHALQKSSLSKRDVILKIIDDVHQQKAIPKIHWTSTMQKKERFVNLIENPKYYLDCFLNKINDGLEMVLVPDGDDAIVFPVESK